MSGDAEYRYPDKTAHEYPKGRGKLQEGMALSEPQGFVTGKDGRICAVLTPGAILCVAPSTSVKLEKLEQLTEGLPSSGKKLKKKIVLDLARGSILVHAGVPSPNMSIRVHTPVGTVDADGGDFIVSGHKGRWRIVAENHEVKFFYEAGEVTVRQGKMLVVRRDAKSGKILLAAQAAPDKSLIRTFDICRTFFEDLEPFVFRTIGTDLEGLASWIGSPLGMVLLGDPTVWHDVSPSFRVPPPHVSTLALPLPEDVAGRLMPMEEIWGWYRRVGVIRGVNYVPRSAVNSTEMWQEDTFDPETIEEELDWAQKMGFNSIRVPLQYVVWKNDPDGLKKRMKKFLSIANDRGMSTVFVLFDDSKYSGREPYLGRQDDPKPGVHNSGWTPSPGLDRVDDRKEWPDLERYVKDIIGEFRRDKRVLFWDLYHTPGNAGMWDKSLPLLESVFRWAREADPRQPLTAGPWTDFGSPMSSRIMELSDVITLQTFDDAEGVLAKLMAVTRFRRPVICTDWLKRQEGSTFKRILPLFAEQGVGWYSRGLVRGRTQTYLPEDHKKPDKEPETWQHDVLHEDGKPYNRREIELIRGFQFAE